jgi:hypothetical protein
MLTLIVSLALLAGPVDLTWGTGPQGLKKLAATPDDLLQKQVLAVLKGYGVKTVERRGGDTKVVWSAADAATDSLSGFSKAERVAVLSLVGRQSRGAEFDLLVPQADGTFAPVSLWWDSPEVVGFASGPTWASKTDATVTGETLKAKYKIGDLLEADAKWTPESLTALDLALGTLSAGELELVSGLKFRRTRASARHAALYQRGDDTNLIDVYDAALSFDGEQFCGEPTAPRPYLLIPLMHELGHAIADARMRQMGLANLELRKKFESAKAEGKATDADFKAADGAVRKLLAIDAANAKGRAVERELLTVFPQNRSPTTYGRTKPAEHFAESFSLWKNDPAALERISPEAAAWFKAGKHVAVAGKSLE